LCRCVQRAFEPTPLIRHPMPEPLGALPSDWPISDHAKVTTTLPTSSRAPEDRRTKKRWQCCARLAFTSPNSRSRKLGCNPIQKYRKRSVADCLGSETQFEAFAFVAVSKACGLHECSGRSSICSIPLKLTKFPWSGRWLESDGAPFSN